MRIRRWTCLVLLASGMGPPAVAAGGNVARGVPVPEGTVVAPSVPGATGPDDGSFGGGTLVINFDDDVSPCVFLSTVPLRNRYSRFGIQFVGPASLDGGAILDQCSNFSVNGYTPPNFLAFNNTASMANGGIPVGPETITSQTALDSVTIGGALFGSATLQVDAFDAGNVLVDSQSTAIGEAMSSVTVSGTGIRSVVVSTNAGIYVLDDLVLTASVDLLVAGVPPKVPGGKNEFWVHGAAPGTVLVLSFDLAPRSEKAPGSLAKGLDAMTVLPVTVGAEGAAMLALDFPSSAGGKTLFVEAIDPASGAASARLEYTIP